MEIEFCFKVINKENHRHNLIYYWVRGREKLWQILCNIRTKGKYECIFHKMHNLYDDAPPPPRYYGQNLSFINSLISSNIIIFTQFGFGFLDIVLHELFGQINGNLIWGKVTAEPGNIGSEI